MCTLEVFAGLEGNLYGTEVNEAAIEYFSMTFLLWTLAMDYEN